MNRMTRETVEWAALFALLIVGLAVALWLACDPEARRESRMELYGEDGP
jgi:hypothetical protein